MLLKNVWLGGSRFNVRIQGGVFSELQPCTDASTPDLLPRSGEWVREGGLLSPHFADPHVHLDATQLGRRYPNREGTLHAGIAIWARAREQRA